jgi:hypothetical protein
MSAGKIDTKRGEGIMSNVKRSRLGFSSICMSVFLCLLVFVLMGTSAFAGRLSFKCTETIKDKIVGTQDPDDGTVYYETVTAGTTRMTLNYKGNRVGNAEDGYEDEFDLWGEETVLPFSISVGDFSFDGEVEKGKVLKVTEEVEDDEGNITEKTVMTVKVTGGKNKLQVVVSAKYPTSGSIGESYIGTSQAFESVISMSCSVGDVEIANDVLILVRAGVKTVLKGKGDEAEEFEVQRMSLSGRSLLTPSES